MQEDISPSYRLRIESITITAVLPSRLFPPPWYYCDVCLLYHDRCGKVSSVVPVTEVDYFSITVVPITVQLFIPDACNVM